LRRSHTCCCQCRSSGLDCSIERDAGRHLVRRGPATLNWRWTGAGRITLWAAQSPRPRRPGSAGNGCRSPSP
jgi:hypothetical protein